MSDTGDPLRFGGATVGPSFSRSGIGRYVNRNANGLQFNQPAIRQSIDKITLGMHQSSYFRHAGMGAALRHTVGLEPVPSHYNDYMYARHNEKVRGEDPDHLEAELRHDTGHDPFQNW